MMTTTLHKSAILRSLTPTALAVIATWDLILLLKIVSV